LRYRALALMRPEEADELLREAQAGVIAKYRSYEALAAGDVIGGAER
jgi:hypothetical protein